MDEHVPFDEILAIHLHRNPDETWYVVVVERDSESGKIRTRHAMQKGGVLELVPNTKQLVFDESI